MRIFFRIAFTCLSLLAVACCHKPNTSGIPQTSGGREIIRLAPDVHSKMLDASFWRCRVKNSHDIIMTKEQIARWNERVIEQTMAADEDLFFVHDLRRFDTVASSPDVRRFMVRYNPSYPWYKKQGGETHKLTTTDWRALYEKMHFAPLGDFSYFSGERDTPGVESRNFPVRKAVTVRRSDLRLVPDDTLYTDDEEYWYDDSAQTSGVLMNEPVLVLWESADKSWLYVRTNYCTGWIHREDVAFCTDEQFARYFDYATQEQSGFVTITADRATLSEDYAVPTEDAEFDGIPELFMGTYLHTADWNDEHIADSFFQRKPTPATLSKSPTEKRTARSASLMRQSLLASARKGCSTTRRRTCSDRRSSRLACATAGAAWRTRAIAPNTSRTFSVVSVLCCREAAARNLPCPERPFRLKAKASPHASLP